MGTTDLIIQIETSFGIKLNRLETFEWDAGGYVIDKDGNIVGLSITEFPENDFDFSAISVLKTLTSLWLSGGNMPDITFIASLKNLKYLNLRQNKISNIEAISKLKHLVTLDLSLNEIEDVAALSNLKNLQDLLLNDNGIRNIASIKTLSKLSKLELSFNSISDISFLENLNELTYLNLNGNNVTDTSHLKGLHLLRHLNIGDNSIDDLSSLQNITLLQSLDLRRSDFTEISKIPVFAHLENLHLSENRITDISFIRNFRKLKYLNLSNNKIADISAISELTELVSVFLDDNQCTNLDPLSSLKNLTDLSIENNSIADITFVAHLSNLDAIWLQDNKIEDISPLKGLLNIGTIDLRNNPIKILPHWITDFGVEIRWQDSINRNAITFFNNPITNIPIATIENGRDAIHRFFQNIAQYGVDYIFEAKVILVGEGSAGKTSLRERLMNAKAKLPEGDTRTRGIKIDNWKFKSGKGKSHIAHVWDFGGQDVYFPVHRFFLTENSVFVLLASTRITNHNFDYWIPTIFQFGGKSPIILGQTCHDGNKVPWNDIDYYIGNSNFNIIKTQAQPYVEINLPNQNEGLSKIRKEIVDQIVSLPHYGKGVPRSWIPVREIISLQSEYTACISFDAFERICMQINPEHFSKKVDIEDCANFLHSIGVILWYKNNVELRHWVVLQPEWAMNAVYKIIDDSEIQNPKRRGTIFARDFKRLWNDECYEGMHSILKKMLAVFKIAFPKKHKREDYIIPARLLSLPNENRFKDDVPYLSIEYKYEFMPKGMVNQVSAELSRYIASDEKVWNNAVNFVIENSSSECQVEEDFYNRKISLKATGKDARGLIMMVMNALKDISEEYKGVSPQIYVPCTCRKCRTLNKPTTFSYDKLIEWSNERDKITCNESGESLLIDELLYNVGLINPFKEKQTKNMSKTVKIFLASSFELENDRKEFEIFINRENKRLSKDGIFIELNIWEDFVDALSKTRLQDEYNKAVTECDIFISLFFTKVGRYTAEEFAKAAEKFAQTGRPIVYTYFKDGQINMSQIKKADINSKLKFEEKLKALGHFPTLYKDIADLKYQFKMQLDKILHNLQ